MEGRDGEFKDKVQTVLTMNSLAPKTNHQVHKSCAEQDQNERYDGARTDLSEKIFAHTHKNKPKSSRIGLGEVRTRHHTPFFEVLSDL